ncbi:uncharacterized protein EI97DRAFT_433057 [Westerdykella ornata]|uniref:Glycerate dehydrogenase n=1 Tax=Westerdykella ornata TaxID=318751 RepID=A0A6A6JKN5_WESOR|nr:uncharacterized protein EI97DRAFT_433057 [Westerdykella ornata]KAF2276824.1 hypothetical protein EI97DRAFT_433057 [Westerdykella ornata]
MHHHIVALETVHQPLPSSFSFPPGTTYTLTTYPTTPPTLLATRIHPATILIVTTIRLPASLLLDPTCTPNLHLIAIMATGTDPVDLAACAARGIRVVNCPGANLDAVSEHAIGLYFAARRRTVLLDRMVRDRKRPSVWKERGSLKMWMETGVEGEGEEGKGWGRRPPLTCQEEVMGVVGYGGLGRRIAKLARGLGMRVVVSGRKGEVVDTDPVVDGETRSDAEEKVEKEEDQDQDEDIIPPFSETETSDNPTRLPFTTVLRLSTVLVLSLPRTPSTLNLISDPELALLSPHTLIVNISRGGIVDEAAVMAALRERRIAGYATDVLAVEPAEGEEDSPLLSDEAEGLNVTVTPHLAWFAERTLRNLGGILKETVEAWVGGRPINVIV